MSHAWADGHPYIRGKDAIYGYDLRVKPCDWTMEDGRYVGGSLMRIRFAGTLSVIVLLFIASGVCIAAPAPDVNVGLREADLPGGLIVSELAEVLREHDLQHGIAVVVGCRDGELVETLGASFPGLLVHGLDADASAIDRGRDRIQKAGRLYGRVSLEAWSKPMLPHASNMANVVVAQHPSTIGDEELQRVVAPRGILCRLTRSGWTVWKKPMPNALDDWPHAFGNVAGTLANHDSLVGPPEVIQWIAGPLYAVKPRIAADGMLFAVRQANHNDSERVIFARDAFNGILVWQGRFTVPRVRVRFSYGWHQDAGVRYCWLSAGRGRLFVLTDPQPVSLNARTGRDVVAFETPEPATRALPLAETVIFTTLHGVYSFEHRGGPPVWSAELDAGDAVTVDGRVFVVDERQPEMSVVALDGSTGKELWRHTPKGLAVSGTEDNRSTTPLRVPCAGEGRVLVWHKLSQPTVNPGHIEGGRITCLDDETGRTLWQIEPQDFGVGSLGYPSYVMMAHDLVWVLGIKEHADDRGRKGHVFTYLGLDPSTGREVKRSDETRITNAICVPAFATGRYIAPRDNLIDVATMQRVGGTATGTRSGCVSSSIPAYGMMFTGSHVCSCGGGYLNYPNQTVKAAIPLDRASESGMADEGTTILEKGPAFGTSLSKSNGSDPDWPTFLADPQRTASAEFSLPTEAVRTIWTTRLPAHGDTQWRSLCADGDAITAPIVADGKVFVANADAMTVYALDAATGKLLWDFTAGGLVDSPPTIARGLCLFGAGDGWLYALEADDGELVWRRRLARSNRRIAMLGTIQSAWPVSGSVLVLGDRVVASAGWYNWSAHRNWIYSLDLATGEIVWTSGTAGPNRNGILAAAADGTVLGHDPNVAPPEPSPHGRRRRGVSFRGPEHFSITQTNPWRRGKGHDTQLTARGDRFVYRVAQSRGQLTAMVLEDVKRYRAEPAASIQLPKHETVEAMIRAGQHLWLAIRDNSHPKQAAGRLRVLSAADLQETATLPLPAVPVFQGLAAADGRLYVCLCDGRVVSIGR